MAAFAAHALLAQHFEFVAETRRRKALPPHLQRQRARVLKRDVGGFQAAVGDKGLRQRFGFDHRGGGFFKGSLKAREVGLGNAQAGGHGVAAEFDDQPGMALGHGIENVAQVHAGNRAAGAAQFAVVGGGEHDGGAVEALFQTAGNNTDHALMEVFAVHRQRSLVFRQGVGAGGERVFQHALLDFLAHLVQAVEFAGDFLRFFQAAGQQAGDADRHIVEPAGGIDARRQRKAHIERLGFGRIAAGDFKQRAHAVAHQAAADALEPLRHHDAVVMVQRHHVGHRAQRHQI